MSGTGGLRRRWTRHVVCCGGRFRERRNLGGVGIELLAGPHAHELAQPPQLLLALLLARARGVGRKRRVPRGAEDRRELRERGVSQALRRAARAQQHVVDHVEEVQHVDVVLRPRQRRQRLGAAPERHEHRRGLLRAGHDPLATRCYGILRTRQRSDHLVELGFLLGRKVTGKIRRGNSLPVHLLLLLLLLLLHMHMHMHLLLVVLVVVLLLLHLYLHLLHLLLAHLHNLL